MAGCTKCIAVRLDRLERTNPNIIREKVERLVELGEEDIGFMPPSEVVLDLSSRRLMLLDGNHRQAALEKLGAEKMWVVFRRREVNRELE